MRVKHTVLIAGLATLFGFGGIGILLMIFFQEKTPAEILFVSPAGLLKQIFFGFLFGAVSSLLLLLLLRRKMLDAARYYFARILKNYQVNYGDILFLSLSAGIGEELFFRGALQPWLGVWLTSFLFIFLHGYLNPKNLPLFIYGTILLLVSSGFGYLMNLTGIYAAMSAHFLIDVVLIAYLKKR